MEAAAIEAFLTHLAVMGTVTASTQNQTALMQYRLSLTLPRSTLKFSVFQNDGRSVSIFVGIGFCGDTVVKGEGFLSGGLCRFINQMIGGLEPVEGDTGLIY